MVQISLINMNSGKLVEQMAGGSIEVQLPSIVKVSLSPEALKSYYRSGNDLIIELKSGEEIVLKDFFIVSADGQRNELVLEDNGRFWHATNGQNEASLSLKEITGIDELLLGESSDNTYMWLLGAIALGGGVAALASGGGGGGGGGGGIKPAVPVIRFDPQSGKVTVEGKPGATVQLKDAAGNAVGA
ncbi:TPA: BapA prefix-like domain-containing protein, partial [Pseudomonas aeruginosa]|nr:BapA prefix-like domain-containing protein [Pseudomonas aeruginosa]